MEEEIKKIKTEADKKKELDEKLKKITIEQNKKEEDLKNLQKEFEIKKNEVQKKDEEYKKLLEEKKKLSEENAKKQADLEAQQKKQKEVSEKSKEVASKLLKEKKEKEEAVKKLKEIEEEKKLIEEKSKKEREQLEKENKIKAEKEANEKAAQEKKLLEEKKALENKLKQQEKEKKEAEERHKRVQEQIKKKAEEDLKRQEKEIDEKIKEGVDKGIEDYKKKNAILNNINVEDDELKANIEELNKQSETYKNQIEDMKKKCYEELNQKYSQIIQKKIEEIHQTIYKDVQAQNQKILDGYVQKFEELERQREEDYTNSMSKIMMSNVQKDGECNISLVKTVHKGIVCKKCGMNPIIGYRYKCSICKDFNLCEKCEEKNYETQEHKHDFIKMRNEEVPKPQPKQVKTEYKYELVEKKSEFNKKIFVKENENAENVTFIFMIKNKSKIDFPNGGKTKLITDKAKSKINIGDIAIEPEGGLKPECISKISFSVEGKALVKGENKIILLLNIDGKNIGPPITFTVKVDVKDKRVEEFRQEFNLNEKEYDYGRLLSLLQKHNFNKENAFASLFNN